MLLSRSLAITSSAIAIVALSAVPAFASTATHGPASEFSHCSWKVENASGSGGLALRKSPGGTLIERMPDGTKVSGSNQPHSEGGQTWLNVVDSRNGDAGYSATAYDGTTYLKEISGSCEPE